jgi:type II secretory pathway component PulF
MAVSHRGLRDFAFVGRDKVGKKVTGHVRAVNRQAAIERLGTRRNIAVLSVSEKVSLSESYEVFLSRFRYLLDGMQLDSAKLLFYRQLAKFLRADIPVDRALTICVEACRNARFAEVIRAVIQSVQDGEKSSLADAMEQHPDEFSQFEIAMIRAGEGARLPEVLKRLVNILSRKKRISSKITRALYYPLFVTLSMVGFVIFIVLYFIPQFSSIAAQLGQKTPPGLLVMKAVGDALTSPMWITLVVVVLIGVFAGFRAALQVPAFADFVDGLTVRRWRVLGVDFGVPVIQRIRLMAIEALFARLFASLNDAAVPLDEALTLVSDALPSRVFKKAVGAMIVELRRTGADLSTLLIASTLFNHDFVSIVAAGEESHTVTDSFDTLGNERDEEVDGDLDALTTIIEPLLVLVMGFFVATIVGTVYSSMYSMISQIK